MAIKLTKKTSAPALDTAEEDLSPFADEIDKLGKKALEIAPKLEEIKRLTAEVNPFKEQLKQLETQISNYLEEKGVDDDAEGLIERGKKFEMTLGKRGSERVITDVEKVMDHMGVETFFKVAKVNLKDVDDYLTPEEKEDCVETNRIRRTSKLKPRS